MNKSLIACTVILLSGASAAPVLAQWSRDSSSNLRVGDGTGDQVQPKIVSTSDGGCYLSWFHDNGISYDVRLQRLDADGHELWDHNGILVAESAMSTMQDYALAVDAEDHALLAFRTERSDEAQITAQRVAPDGTPMWGAEGVLLGNGTDYVFSPKIATITDGTIVLGWTNHKDVRLARLDTAGDMYWDRVVVIRDSVESFALSDLHESDHGSVIASLISQTSLHSPRHLSVQKVAATGATVWTTSVFDDEDGSLAFDDYPTFVPDGAGGAVLTWYDDARSGPCYVQRVLADGREVFPHNGIAVSPRARGVCSAPRTDFDPDTQDVFVFWVSGDDIHGQRRGVAGQKIDDNGERRWGDAGVALVLPNHADYQVDAVAFGGGAIVFYSESTRSRADRIYAARLDAQGDHVWQPSVIDVSSSPASKLDVFSILATEDRAMLTWENTAKSDSDIMAQNVNGDGTLGR